MRPLTPLLAFGLALGLAGPAPAQTLKVGYGITLSGIPLGTADLATSFEGQRYRMELAAKLTGLAGLLTSGRGAATASGAFAGAQPAPSSFALTSRASGDQRTVRMGLSSGQVAALEIVPPLDAKPDRVPLAETHKRGVIDPVSALLMPARGDVRDTGNCNRTIPVFDGAARFDIVLTYAETRQVEKPGYRGPVLVCNARYVPIAGHRSLRPATKFMQDNQDMQVWLAPVESARVLVPLRIAVRTMAGMSIVEASRWALDDGKAVPGAAERAARASVAQ
jgi:hypothetical protein